MRAAPLAQLALLHLAVALQVLLVAEDEEGEVLRVLRHALLEEVRSPALQILKALVVRDVADEDARLGPAVEGRTE